MFTGISDSFGPWGDIWLRGGWRVQTHAATQTARLLDPAGRCILLGTREACLDRARERAPHIKSRRAAVLLHGLWNHPGIMRRLETALAERDWEVANTGYSSRLVPLAVHAQAAAQVARGLAEDGAEEIAFICHSLGGLVARCAMAHAGAQGWRPGPLVLIGSPARGAAFVQQLQRLPWCKTAIGACHGVLVPACALTIPPPAAPRVMVIAGGTGRRGFNPLIPEDNDSLIAVSETRLPLHETAFLRVRALHRSLPLRREVVTATLGFVESQ